MNGVSDIFARRRALEIRYIVVVSSWLDKYNCHLLLNPSLTQSDEFSYIKVQDVVTNRTGICTKDPPMAGMVLLSERNTSFARIHSRNRFQGYLNASR